MMLKCKILPKYLDEILQGRKQIEYREIEGIEFNDGTRKVVVNIKNIDNLIDNDFLIDNYPDIKWGDKLKIRIFLGSVIC